MGFNLGKLVGKAVGVAAFGPVGFALGSMYNKSKQADRAGRDQMNQQMAENDKQRNQVRSEQNAMNMKIEASRAKGAAKAARGRGRGGIFGEPSGDSGQGPLNPRLG